MNKRQLQIQKIYLNNEKAVIKELKHAYSQTLAEVGEKIKILQSSDMTQAKIYQLQYQLSLQSQVSDILDKLRSNNYNTIQEYLDDCYRTGFLGTMYDLQGQGIPLAFPLNQAEIIKAIQLDSPIKEGMYKKLGYNIHDLKKRIADEITRGISAGLSFQYIARNLKFYADLDYNKSIRIIRTEGHRIRESSTYDCQRKAKQRGANVVKQWDSTLDGKTRPVHRALDGQIKEIDELFEAEGYSARFPSDFGDPSQDCNCRCCSVQRARWALNATETKFLGDTDEMTDDDLQPLAEKLGMTASQLRNYKNEIIPINAKNYDDFKSKYNSIWKYEGSELEKHVNETYF